MGQPLPADDLDLVLSLTPGFWRRFAGQRLLVTGATGFVGNWLVQAVQRANDTLGSGIAIVALTRDAQRARRERPEAFARADVELVTGDVRSFAAPAGRLDLCIHAATDVADPARSGDAQRLFDSIVEGTRHVLDVARSRGVSRFLLTSSGAVYGTQPPALAHVPESHAGAPDPLQVAAAYGNGKRAAEWLACAAAADGRASGFEATIARIFALLGPGIPLDGPFAAGNFIRDALADRPIAVQGDGRPLRSYLYMADLCVWLLRLLESGASGEAYNVGSEQAISIRDLAAQVLDAAGSSHGVEVRGRGDGNELPPRYVPDTRKAREALDLRELTPLPLALRKTLQWTRATQLP